MIYIPDYELSVKDEDVFNSLDLNLLELKKVKEAYENNDLKTAKKELIAYFKTRKNVNYFYDYRTKPSEKIDTDTNPYFFQSALGLSGSLKEFMLRVADKMLDNIYLLPGTDRGEVFLGKDLDQMIKFDFLKDQGKRHRGFHDQFVRGQFFESLVAAYHETGEQKYLDKFIEILNKFFETYPLKVVDGSPSTNRFQLDDDRDVMSSGWLCLVYISLFYTAVPYLIDEDLAFEIIKRIWFLGIQFRRFDTDSYRAYNHHLFERGLVPLSLSILLPEFPDFKIMRERGINIVQRHIKEDFNEVGGYSEHSISYWAGAALGEMLTRGIVLSRINNINLLDKESFERINASFSLLAKLAKPGERYPNIGDNKGPMINPILRLGILAVDNEDCKNVLACRVENKNNLNLPPYDYANDKAGFAISRNGYKDDSNYLVMSAKTNCGYTGHNHMDMLSLILVLKGKEIVGEPYSGKLYKTIRMRSPQRGYMYNMSSHNSVLCYGRPIIDDSFYSNKWGVYRPDSPISKSKTTEDGFYVEAFHTAYTFCLHRRSLYFNREHGLIVHDKVERGNRYEMDHIQRWNLGIGSKVERLSDNSLIISVEDVDVLLIAKEAKEIIIWKNDLLFPEIYPDSNDVYPTLDILFQSPDRLIADNAPSDINTLFLDITGKKESAKKKVKEIEDLVQDKSPEEMISSISKMANLLG